MSFNEYIEKLEEKYLLSNKHVEFKLDNADQNIYDSKLMPFFKDKPLKKVKIISWYDAYNKIKHDRVKSFKNANLNNLIHALAALFILNIYYLDNIYYSKFDYNKDSIIEKIEGISKIFEVGYTVYISPEKEKLYAKYRNENSFFDPINYFKIALPSSTYIIY